jgi:hypothetical protein
VDRENRSKVTVFLVPISVNRLEEKTTFQISYYEGRGKYRRFFVIEDNIIWTPISKITFEHFDGFVYNLETEETHNYISSFLMHNCSRGAFCADSECRYGKKNPKKFREEDSSIENLGTAFDR